MLQAEPRYRKRVPCTLRTATRGHAGMVLNLSRGGLFVQTSAHLDPGQDVSVELNVASGIRERGACIPLGTRVVWRRIVAPQLRTVSHGGFGVRIENASEDYYRFLSGLVGSSSQPPQPAATSRQPAGDVYRVRLKQTSGPRTRWVSVRSRSESEAGRQALAQVGAGWDVLTSERAD